MKTPAPWLELSLVAAALMVGMLGVMWAERPDASCTWPLEPARQLVLSRETDREHLDTDVGSTDRIARRYVLSVENPAERHTRFVDCKATLFQEIAMRHGLSPERVRSGLIKAR